MMPTTSFGAAGSFLTVTDCAFTINGKAMIKLLKILCMYLYLKINKCTGNDCFSGVRGLKETNAIEKTQEKG